MIRSTLLDSSSTNLKFQLYLYPRDRFKPLVFLGMQK